MITVIKVIINIAAYIVYFVAAFYFIILTANSEYHLQKAKYVQSIIDQNKRDDTVLSPEDTKRLRQLEKQRYYNKEESDELFRLEIKHNRTMMELIRKAEQEYKQNNPITKKDTFLNMQTNTNIFLIILFFVFVILFNHTYIKMFLYSLPFLILTSNSFEIVGLVSGLYFIVAFSVVYILSWLAKMALKKAGIRLLEI